MTIPAVRGNMVREIKNLLYIIVGISLYAVGFTIFILPHHVVIGGMAGFSTLIFYASGQTIPVAVTMYGANLLLLACGYKYLGRGFVLRTIFGATVMSLVIGSIESYFTSHPPFVTDSLLSIALGAVLCGIGIGIYYSHEGTAGGTDIVAAVMTKFTNASMGRVMMIVDISIVACSFFLPFEGDLEARADARTQSIIYGWLAIFLYSYVADKFIYQDRQTVQFIILTYQWEKVGHRITHETGRGVTTWDGKGFWTGEDRKLMLVWCRRTDMERIMMIVREEDRDAYITESMVHGVYGNGFDTLRLKPRKKTEGSR